jgi:hypothetical protein
MKNAVFWDVTPCRYCVNWRFGGIYRSGHLLTLVPRSQIFIPRKFRLYVISKRRFTQYLHGATSQKTAFFNTKEHNISETGYVSVFIWEVQISTFQWLWLAFSIGPNTVGVSQPLTWGRKQIELPKRCVLQCSSEYWTVDKVQNPRNRERYTPSSETFFFLWRYSPHLGLGLPPCNFPFHFSLLDLGHSVGLLGRVISSSQGLSLFTNTEKRTYTNTKHPWPELDSNPRSRVPSERRQYTP